MTVLRVFNMTHCEHVNITYVLALREGTGHHDSEMMTENQANLLHDALCKHENVFFTAVVFTETGT